MHWACEVTCVGSCFFYKNIVLFCLLKVISFKTPWMQQLNYTVSLLKFIHLIHIERHIFLWAAFIPSGMHVKVPPNIGCTCTKVIKRFYLACNLKFDPGFDFDRVSLFWQRPGCMKMSVAFLREPEGPRGGVGGCGVELLKVARWLYLSCSRCFVSKQVGCVFSRPLLLHFLLLCFSLVFSSPWATACHT